MSGLILTLFFFEPTREILLFSASDAYIAVSSFVGVTLLIFVFLEKRNFNLQRFIEKNKNYEIPTSAFLGVIPGCGGAIMVMSLYTRGVVSFGSVLAALIATMGDAAFLLIASKPQAALVILPVTFLTGIVFGYLVKPFTKNFINKISLKKDLNKNLPKNKIDIKTILRIMGAAEAAANLLCEFKIAAKKEDKLTNIKNGRVILVKFIAN